MTDPFSDATKASFSDALRQANEILFEKFRGNHASHCIDCPDLNGALRLLRRLSFVSGSSFENLCCPDFAHISIIRQDRGVFLVLGGLLSRDQNIEIRRAADRFGFQAQSMTTADEGTAEHKEFMAAVDVLRNDPKPEKKKRSGQWWQFWK